MQGRTLIYFQGRIPFLVTTAVAVLAATAMLLLSTLPVTAFGDSSPPAAPEKLKVGPKKWTKKDKFNVSWKNPKGAKRVKTIVGAYYKIDSAPKGSQDGIYVSQKKGKKKGSIKGIKVGSPGNHTIYVWLKDKAGNLSGANSATGRLKFDNTPPSAPVSFRESPTGWSSTDGFSVSWNSAASTDAAPIVGAYYKLDKPPKRKKNGTYVKLGDDSGSSIVGINVETEGSHPIYVWLKDAAGNVSQANRAEGSLKFDKTPPDAPADLMVDPNGWTAKNSFTVKWVNPDTSGAAPITGAYYKLDTLPTGADDGSYAKLSYTDRKVGLYGLRVPAAGKHSINVWLKDAAGNISHKYIASGYLLYAPKESKPPKKQPPPKNAQPQKPRPKPPDSDPLDSELDSGTSSPGEDAGMPQFDPPLITSLNISRKHFRAKGQDSKNGADKWKVGTTIDFTLTRSSTMTFTVVRNIAGRKKGRSCMKRTKVSRNLQKKGIKCSLFKTVGSFTRQANAGNNTFKFSGRLNGKRLRPGLYHVYVRVGGTKTTAPPHLSFRVVRGR